MLSTARRGSGLCAHRVDQGRQRRQWAVTAAVALAAGCCGGCGTAGLGHQAHGRMAGLRALGSG